MHRILAIGSGRRLRQAAVVTLTAALAAALLLAAPAPAAAHILNEKTQFPDIEFVDARLDIVLLVGAGLIPQTPVFLPDDPLSGYDLAAWAALARGLGEGGETPDTDALAEAALAAGYVTTLDEPATYAEINRLLFDDALDLPGDLAAAVPTRAEAAAFVAGHLFDEVAAGLREGLGIRPGPTGFVDAVQVNDVAPGDHHSPRYSFVFGDTAYGMDPHGRVGNGPVDLLQWEGAYVVRSLLQGDGDAAVLTYIEAGEPAAEAGEADEAAGESGEAGAGTETGAGEPDAAGTGEGTAPAAGEEVEAAPGTDPQEAAAGFSPWLWVALIAAIVALGGFLFAGGRRRS